MRPQSTIPWSWRGLSLAVAMLSLAALQVTTEAAPRRCVTVSVPDPLELPDGSLHQAGTLTLCAARCLSPVAQWHQVSVNGIPVGFLLSREGKSEGPASAEPFVTFHRDRRGRLLLIGYAWPDGRHSQTFLLRDPRPPGEGRASAGRAARAEEGAESEAPQPPALLAAISP